MNRRRKGNSVMPSGAHRIGLGQQLGIGVVEACLLGFVQHRHVGPQAGARGVLRHRILAGQRLLVDRFPDIEIRAERLQHVVVARRARTPSGCRPPWRACRATGRPAAACRISACDGASWLRGIWMASWPPDGSSFSRPGNIVDVVFDPLIGGVAVEDRRRQAGLEVRQVARGEGHALVDRLRARLGQHLLGRIDADDRRLRENARPGCA